MVWWQQPRSSASRRLDGQQESLARAYSSKAAASTIAVRFPLRWGSLRNSCGRAAKGMLGLDWVPRGAPSPHPVRGTAAGVEYRVVGQFTAAPPVPRHGAG
ncbi:MAG TPA: hypothetical protein VJY33_23480, partial [Isosphaeraceae bacterium]|nr:hypothetical protein [Isosphaeraceae bacterium]